MRNFLSGKNCLTLVIIQKVQSYFETNKKVIRKIKDEFGGVFVIEFVRLKSKMYLMKEIDGKECNTTEGVKVTTEFNKFKDVLFNQKIIRHKMKRTQSKIGTYEIDNNLCHILMIKDTC